MISSRISKGFFKFEGIIPNISSSTNLGDKASFSYCEILGFLILETRSLAILIACFSSSAKKSDAPEILLCIRAPPSSSSLASSLVAILTKGGPAKNTLALFFCMIV